MLPPEAPISSILELVSERNIAGVMEEGGRSPGETASRKPRGVSDKIQEHHENTETREQHEP